jgi:hypothetical protein
MTVSKRFFSTLAAAALCAAAPARASVILYSFENADSPNALDGFAKNGSGISVASSSIGPTAGTGSISVATTGPGFKSILTASIPAVLDNPLVTGISVDVTIPPSPAYTGTFADLGVIMFVDNLPLGEFGEQFQVASSEEQNINLAPGTHTVTIPLMGSDPDTGALETYAQLLSHGFIPAGFDLFFDENAANSVFLDNVQAVGVSAPEPASLALLILGGLLLLKRRANSYCRIS